MKSHKGENSVVRVGPSSYQMGRPIIFPHSRPPATFDQIRWSKRERAARLEHSFFLHSNIQSFECLPLYDGDVTKTEPDYELWSF